MRDDDPNLPQLRRIAEALGALREQVGFVGPLGVDPDFANALPGLIAETERAALVTQRLKALCP